MMDIPLDLYRVFFYVAREGGFSRAAQRLHISQSAVSQSIKRLEEQLGQRLLTRTSRRIALTAEGQKLLPLVEKAIRSLEDIGAQYDEGASGPIRLGAGDTVFRYYLLTPLKQFAEKYPAIRFQVTNRTSGQLMRMMREGALDLAIVSQPADAALDDMLPFADMTYVFAAPEKHYRTYLEDPGPAALARIPLLLPEKGTTARRNLDNYLYAMDITLKPEIELESVDLLIDLARIGMGAAFAPEQSVAPYLDSGELHILPDIHMRQALRLYLPGDALIPAGARLFIQSLRGLYPPHREV